MLVTRSLMMAALLPLSAATSFATGDLSVRDAWIAAAPPNAPVMAGYMTVENHARGPKTLIAATSREFGEVTMHRTEMHEGVARMTHAAKVEIAPHGKVAFQPGGYHLMLAQAKRPIRSGDAVPVDLSFADGTHVPVVFRVREPARTAGSGSPAPAHDHASMHGH